MSALRYSGNVRIRVTYVEPKQGEVSNGHYRCFLTDLRNGHNYATIVGAPATLSRAVDSPEAFDDAARAALSFAGNDSEGRGIALASWGELAIHGEMGIHIGRDLAFAVPPPPTKGYDGTEVRKGDRIELSPSMDLWMRGARYGSIVRISTQSPIPGTHVCIVRMDRVRRLQRVPSNCIRKVPPGSFRRCDGCGSPVAGTLRWIDGKGYCEQCKPAPVNPNASEVHS